MTSASDETIQIYNVREGRHDKSLLSKKYGVKLAKFTHTRSSIIYASTKQNRKWPHRRLPVLSLWLNLDVVQMLSDTLLLTTTPLFATLKATMPQ